MFTKAALGAGLETARASIRLASEHVFDYNRAPMPIICVLAPAFRLHVARLSDPDVPTAGPVLVADKPERGRVIECSAAASALGVRPGMTLVQAQAAARDARVVIDDPRHDAGIWQAMLEALDAASPLIDDAGLGCAYLEMHGIEGGTAGWLAAVRGALSGFDLPLRLGLAANPFVARAAALVGDGTSLDDGMAADFLAPLPLETLELDTATIERLAILGIRTLGELAALPHGPFVRRFGPEGAVWHDRARGDRSASAAPARPRACASTAPFMAKAARRAKIRCSSRCARSSAEWSTTWKSRANAAARWCWGWSAKTATSMRSRPASPSRPRSQPRSSNCCGRAWKVSCSVRPVVGLRLAAGHLENGGVQIALFAAGDPDPDALGIAIARLDAALGEDHALRARVVEGPRIESALCPRTLYARHPGEHRLVRR